MRHAVLLLAAILIPALPAAAQGRPGVDFTAGLTQIVEGVYAYEGPLHLDGEEEIVRTNSLVIVTEDGVIVVDGQDDMAEGQRMIDAIAEITTQPIRYLINASPHGDHINSNELFRDAIIVAHEGAYEAIAAVRERNEASGSDVLPTLPHHTYTDKMTLRLGGRTVELHYFGLGHTRGDTVVFLPEEGVAFLSELYFNDIFASVGEGYALEHLTTLRRAMELPAQWWIPGHGYIRDQSQADLADGVGAYYDNVEAIYAAVALHVARGDTLEETLEAIEDDLGALAELPFFEYLRTSAISGTYRALARQ
jgi:cyclase